MAAEWAFCYDVDGRAVTAARVIRHLGMFMTPVPLLKFENTFSGRRVLVTGHTGFKGSWLSLWLASIGAKVYGVSLAPETVPNLFEAASIARHVEHSILDINDRGRLLDYIVALNPEYVFHLAAQPLVRRSYSQPLETLQTNIMGTAHVLEACRQAPDVRAIISVTTDKVYQNKDWVWGYRESDRLGGHDPYSSSKACAELVAECYRNLLKSDGQPAALATARGGNIIGGGDWSEDRLVPDYVRALERGLTLTIRNPKATRPWQHVLALCHGYLLLAARLAESSAQVAGPWNFGPETRDVASVETLLSMLGHAWASPKIDVVPDRTRYETQMLAVDSTKARASLGWNPPWGLNETVARTASWYRQYLLSPNLADALMRADMEAYRTAISPPRNAE